MAQLIISVDDAQIQDVLDTLCEIWGYSGPEAHGTKAGFVRAKLIKYLRRAYYKRKMQEAQSAAADELESLDIE